ncbi:MAG TPA: dienelactone hydrolase family protein [Methylotenera sp.]|nr:dienelactone hydrolase family protein [Methylotenera sp.]
MSEAFDKLVHIPADNVHIEGMLELPANARGIVLFAHGSGSSRHSPRNNYVAKILHSGGMGTLLMDLLTSEEDMDYQVRFDIPLLTRRLLAATHWLQTEQQVKHLPIAYFGASTGAAAALQAASVLDNKIKAVVSRGGRPDLAGADNLSMVTAPTLLLIGGLDDVVIELNQEAYNHMHCTKHISIIPGATHLFEEPGTLETVASLASDWFKHYLSV